MEKCFEDFLDQYYLTEKKKSIEDLLRLYEWRDLFVSRVNSLIENEDPDYVMITASLIQSLNDRLRKFDDLSAKIEAEQILGELFRNLIGYLINTKSYFLNKLPELVKTIEDLYSLNGDNFEELEKLVNFRGFLERIEKSVSLDNPRKTLFLKWDHPTGLSQLVKVFEKHSVLPSNSNFEQLFTYHDQRQVFISNYRNSTKKFTLVMGELFDRQFIKPVGGGGTWKFLEENVKIKETGNQIKGGYFRKTYNNTKNENVGIDKYMKFISEFMKDLEPKSRQSKTET